MGYPGQFSQSATEGTIEVTFPRVASVNDSWDVEYTIQNDNRETLISKPVTNAQTQNNFSVNISSGRLSEGTYRQDLTLKQNESDPGSKQILRVFDLDGIRITDGKTVDNGDTDTGQDVTETASVTDGQATVTFPSEQTVTETRLTNLSADVSSVSVTPSSTNPSSDAIGLPTAGGGVGTFLEIAPENNAGNDVSITQDITVTVTVEDSVVSGITNPTLYHDVNSNGTYEPLDTEVSAGTDTELTATTTGLSPFAVAEATASPTPDSPLEGAAGDFDADGNGEISIIELGQAGQAFASGELSITELGQVGAAFAS